MAFSPLQTVLAAELEAVMRRRQRVGSYSSLPSERTSGGCGSQRRPEVPASDVSVRKCGVHPALHVRLRNWSTGPSRDVRACVAPHVPLSPHSISRTAQVRDLKDTVGVCISAGGLRSVAFGVGALRALATAGAIPPRAGLRLFLLALHQDYPRFGEIARACGADRSQGITQCAVLLTTEPPCTLLRRCS